MKTNFNNILTILETSIAKGKSNDQLQALMENFTIPEQVTTQQLSRTYAILFPWFLKSEPDYYKDNSGRSLYWKAKEWFSQTLYDRVYENRKWIRGDIERATKRGEPYKKEQEIAKEHNYPPEIQCPFTTTEVYNALLPYFNFTTHELTKTLYPYVHLTIVWDVLQKSQKPIKKAFTKWFKVLEEKQLVEPHFDENMAQAIEWNIIAEKNDLTTITKKDFDQWIVCLDHPNPVLRGVAAKCIGGAYEYWEYEDDEFQAHKHIPITDMLEILYQKQVVGKNVVGGFIAGYCADRTLIDLEEHEVLVAQKFDVKAWVLKTIIDSPEEEPYIPGSQAFWFFVHEYLDYDPESVHTLIDGKRYWLAMMCATESIKYSYQKMKPVLERLIKEAPQETANETQRQVNLFLEQEAKGNEKRNSI